MHLYPPPCDFIAEEYPFHHLYFGLGLTAFSDQWKVSLPTFSVSRRSFERHYKSPQTFWFLSPSHKWHVSDRSCSSAWVLGGEGMWIRATTLILNCHCNAAVNHGLFLNLVNLTNIPIKIYLFFVIFLSFFFSFSFLFFKTVASAQNEIYSLNKL